MEAGQAEGRLRSHAKREMPEERKVAPARRPEMRRRVALGLDEFGREILDELARSLAVTPGTIVRQAALHLLSEHRAGRSTAKVPRFVRDREIRPRDRDLTLDLELDETDWSALEIVAVAQRVSLERLLEHATMLFLADVESGRLAVRIVEEEEREEKF
jgi:hypothetical protein